MITGYHRDDWPCPVNTPHPGARGSGLGARDSARVRGGESPRPRHRPPGRTRSRPTRLCRPSKISHVRSIVLATYEELFHNEREFACALRIKYMIAEIATLGMWRYTQVQRPPTPTLPMKKRMKAGPIRPSNRRAVSAGAPTCAPTRGSRRLLSPARDHPCDPRGEDRESETGSNPVKLRDASRSALASGMPFAMLGIWAYLLERWCTSRSSYVSSGTTLMSHGMSQSES